MIYQIYFSLVALSLVFVFLGYYLNGFADVFSYAGYTFLTLLALMLVPGVPGALEFSTGVTETYVYGDNFTSYHWDYDYSNPKPVLDVYLFHKYEVEDLEEYENAILGIYIALVGVAGFINTLIVTRESGGF